MERHAGVSVDATVGAARDGSESVPPGNAPPASGDQLITRAVAEAADDAERALVARRMRARYLVGRDAHVMLALRRLLPDLVFDRLVRRGMGL